MLNVMGQTGTRAVHDKPESSSVHNHENSSEQKRLVDALSELHDLLEAYAPWWYTEEHHRHAELALHTGKKH
jgi:hypothetical protein